MPFLSTDVDDARRRAFILAYLNGAFWSLGNGLASTALIVYLARQLGAAGLGIGAILAAPHLVGWLRLVAPAVIGRWARRKSFCVLCYGISALVLVAIASLAEPGRLGTAATSLAMIIGLWCVYHLFEYLGTVALWAWLGDLIPQPIRGTILGRRETAMMLARIVGMLGGGGFAWFWSRLTIQYDDFAWLAYALPAWLGAACMLAALLPLLRLRDDWGEATFTSHPPLLAQLVSPWGNWRMRRLIAFGLWFSLANGLTQSAQFLYPLIAVGLTLLARNAMISTMRAGQAVSALGVGPLVDAVGSRRVMVVSQLIVATGPLFILAGCKWHWLWLWGAWLAWIAYVGLNIGIPALCLKLAGPKQASAFIATYFAAAGVVYAVASIAGGALFDWLEATRPMVQYHWLTIDRYDLQMIGGFVLRAMAVIFLLGWSEDEQEHNGS